MARGRNRLPRRLTDPLETGWRLTGWHSISPCQRRTRLLLALVATIAPRVLAAEYRSASVDQRGQLHIVLDNGKEILPPKIRDQSAFGSPSISPDGRTVGWLVMYPDPTVTYYKGAQLAGKLVIYRAGSVLHTFTTAQ